MHSTVFALRAIADSKNGEKNFAGEPEDLTGKATAWQSEKNWDSCKEFSSYEVENEMNRFVQSLRIRGHYSEDDPELIDWNPEEKTLTVMVGVLYQILWEDFYKLQEFVKNAGGSELADWKFRQKLKDLVNEEGGYYVYGMNFEGLQTLDDWIPCMYTYLINNKKLNKLDSVTFKVEKLYDYKY